MSTTTSEATRASDASRTSRPDHRVTQTRVIASEWTKLYSLRSTVFSLLAAVVFIIGLAILVPAVTVNHWPPREPGAAAAFDPTSRTLNGIFLAQLAVGVLGVLFVTGEYASGMIKATFAAVPSRLPVLWGKALVFGAVTFVLSLPAVVVAFLIGQGILSGKHLETTLGAPDVLRAVIGSALYLTVIGLLGLGLGALLRNTAAGISTLFGVLLVIPVIVRFLPSSWSDPINKYLPGTAGEAITRVHVDPSGLGPWAGFAVFVGYAAVVLLAAALSWRRRDA